MLNIGLGGGPVLNAFALMGGGGEIATIVSGASSRTKIAGAYDLATVGYDGMTWIYSQTDMPFDVDGSELELFSNNYGTPAFNAGEWGTGFEAILSQVCEYPIGSGNKYPVTFAAAASKSMPDGGVSGWADKLPFNFTKGTKCRVYSLLTFPNGSNSAFVPTYRSLAGELCYRGTGAAPAVGTTPGASGTLLDYANYGPSGMRCKQAATNKPIIWIDGDSNTVDQSASTLDLAGNRTYTAAFSGVQSVMTSCFTGRRLESVVEAEMRGQLAEDQGCVDAFYFLGINNIDGTATLAEIQSLFTTAAANAQARGITPHFATLSPNENFTAPEIAIYTALNPWLRAQFDVFELADIVSVSRDSNTFKPGYSVGDGLHINWANGTAKAAIIDAFKTYVQAMGYPTI